MKNRDILLDAIGEVDEKLIPELSDKNKRSVFIKWGALAACLCIAAIGAAAWIKTPRLPQRSDEPAVTSPTGISEDFTTELPPSEAVTTTETPVTTQSEVTTSATTEAPPQTEVTTVPTTEAPPKTEKTTEPTTTVTTTEATTTTTEKTTVTTTREPPPTLTPLNADPVLLAEPFYPYVPMYPTYSDDYTSEMRNEWGEAIRTLRNQPEGYKDGFNEFFLNTSKVFLKNLGDENRLYSPLSLFMALSVSAEISGGNTRAQILNVLQQDSIETLRSHAKSIWQANYMDDGMAKCVLANSLWTNNGVSYNLNTVDSVAENYYSSVYSGNPSSEEYNKLMQDWLNEQTDGLLEDYVSGIKMSPETVLMIASTVNYSGKWKYKFLKSESTQSVFHSPTGDIVCEFMNSRDDETYYWGDNFAAISMNLENNGEMRILLPDEGVSPVELLSDSQVVEFMLNRWNYENQNHVIVNMSIPKFDISSSIDLNDGLKKLGITDAFSPYDSDFSPLTEQSDGFFIGKAEQDTRVIIDEEGCKASSLTVMMTVGAAPVYDRADFIVDRPFVFEIVSQTGLPLFIGIVNVPMQ